MSRRRFEELLPQSKIGKNDRVWLPKWLRSFQGFLQRADHEGLVVDPDTVKHFCRQLLASGTKAWQRLQAVRAIEHYQSIVLKTGTPSLADIKQVLINLSRDPDLTDVSSSLGISPDGRR